MDSLMDQQSRPFWLNHKKRTDPTTTGRPLQKSEANPIAASTQSRSKLHAFQYHEIVGDAAENTNEPDMEKENLAPESESAPEQEESGAMDPPACPSSQISLPKEARDCPQTPIGRLPLSQLLGNGDDDSQGMDLTPVERVLWDNACPEFGSFDTSSTPRKRKRASSSTPPSASQTLAPTVPTPKRAQALKEALKTPKANVGDDLWSRYSLHTTDKHALSPNAVQPPHTFHSSSPQTPASKNHARDSGGLRRAFSCIDWPTSDAKRRRLKYDLDDRMEALKSIEQDQLATSVEDMKASRVSRLVDKLHGDLLRPLKRDRASSDAPATSSAPQAPPQRIIENPQLRENDKAMDEMVNGLSQAAVDDRVEQIEAPPPVKQTDEPCEASSSFGGDDLDLELFETLAKQADQAVEKPKSADDENGPERIDQFSEARGANIQLQDKEDEDDEFDDDGDFFDAETEQMLAKYDTQPVEVATRNPETTSIPTSNGKSLGDPARETLAPKSKQQDSPKPIQDVHIVSDDEDDYGGDSDFEQLAAILDDVDQGAQSGSTGKQNTCNASPALRRLVIKQVFEGDLMSASGTPQPEKVLYVQEEKGKIPKTVLLRQSWVDSPCTAGMTIHVVGDFDKRGQCVIDNTSNFLILHPDHLVSSTVVGDSFTCMRKAVLEDRVKATSDASQATIYGHMLHEIFQEAMKANRWDDAWMERTIDSVTRRHLEDLYEVNATQVAVGQLKERVAELQAWAEVFVSAKPKPNAVIKERNGTTSLMCVNKLLEVEEKVWSPRFGLKGNVDATVQVIIDDRGTQRTLTVPFELKTGKMANAAHKAQTSLYTLLLSDRYDVEIACGILYYMQTSETSNVRAMRHELLPMILQRNNLAGFVRQRTVLPPMIQRPYTCGKCYAKTTCFAYHKLVEDGNGETSGMGDKFDDIVRHLKAPHQEFFVKWDGLLTKEERDIVKIRRELWTMEGAEREKVGRCFGGMVIEPGSAREEMDAPKINRFTYAFVKQRPDPNVNFVESQITVGEPIVISDEKGHFALANGYVSSIRKRKIHVVVDRRLHNARTREKGFNAETNQSFVGIMNVADEVGRSPPASESEVYRLDKDEFSNGMAMIRNNLVKVMDKDLLNGERLRQLIVEGHAPSFKELPPTLSSTVSASQANLNIDQRAAIGKIMSAKDYALVLGMPGTGKTTTIAHIIRSLVAKGKNVLLTSYTHSAVDNILLKLKADNIGIFRIGAMAKIHPDVQEFADLSSRPKETVEDLERCYNRQVVATTCLGIGHPVFRQRVFDYCIVDEASQITLPVCLGPIRMAKTFVLVGDHYQLPPLVQNKEAQEGGLDVSLFKMLSDTHPDSVTNLEHQYRMCEEIMTLSNRLIYKGRLKCGTPAVASQSLHIPDLAALKAHHHTPTSLAASATTTMSLNPKSVCLGTSPTSPTANSSSNMCWLNALLRPTVKACFINTDTLGPTIAHEVLEPGSNRITNPAEATLTTQLVESLLTVGIDPSQIGVITLYRSQLALIKQSLRHLPQAIEMHTADRFQGRDKDVIVLSLVRSNEGQIVGDLLKDWRRVNVALTRARTKLLILGSQSTLAGGNELLKEMTELMQEKCWWFDLPPGAMEGHVWVEHGTPMDGSGSARSSSAAVAKKMASLQSMGVSTLTQSYQSDFKVGEDLDPRMKVDVKLEKANDDDDCGNGEGENKENRCSSPGIGNGGKSRANVGTRQQQQQQQQQRQQQQFKKPSKQGRLDVAGLIGKRPVLRDIVNDAA